MVVPTWCRVAVGGDAVVAVLDGSIGIAFLLTPSRCNFPLLRACALGCTSPNFGKKKRCSKKKYIRMRTLLRD
jgi:hypothetical protein